MDSVTQLLTKAATGDEAANARFLAVVYRELRQLAAASDRAIVRAFRSMVLPLPRRTRAR